MSLFHLRRRLLRPVRKSAIVLDGYEIQSAKTCAAIGQQGEGAGRGAPQPTIVKRCSAYVTLPRKYLQLNPPSGRAWTSFTARAFSQKMRPRENSISSLPRDAKRMIAIISKSQPGQPGQPWDRVLELRRVCAAPSRLSERQWSEKFPSGSATSSGPDSIAPRISAYTAWARTLRTYARPEVT